MSTNINNPTPANIDTSSLDVLRPLPFNPEPIAYNGTFIRKYWDVQEKDGKITVKELVVEVELEKKNELDQQVVVERRYNMLPRARRISDFKKDIASYLGYRVDKTVDEFPAKFLANITLLSVDTVFFSGTMRLCNGMKSFGNAA
jgi:hypothetical protein